jgi:hypothetical protein
VSLNLGVINPEGYFDLFLGVMSWSHSYLEETNLLLNYSTSLFLSECYIILANGSKYFMQIMIIKYNFLFFHDFPSLYLPFKRGGLITAILASLSGNNAKKFKNNWAIQIKPCDLSNVKSVHTIDTVLGVNYVSVHSVCIDGGNDNDCDLACFISVLVLITCSCLSLSCVKSIPAPENMWFSSRSVSPYEHTVYVNNISLM